MQLPPPVEMYVARALASDAPVPRRVRLTQEGEMRRELGGRALRFTASQALAVHRAAFSWHARFPLVGPVALDVVDELDDNRGTLDVSFLGLRLQRHDDFHTSIGQRLRYLAELPWVPHAMARNQELEWSELGDGLVEVVSRQGAVPCAVTFEFDDRGDIVRASSHARPRRVGNEWIATPWVGEYADYEILGGLRVPSRATVSWKLPHAAFAYWCGRVTSLERDYGRA